jgi:hypothetical protein
MSRWGLPGSVVCRKVPAGPVQVTACRRWSSARIRFQVQDPPGGGLRDADQQQGEPAQQDVGAYPVLAPVVDGPQVKDLLHVAPAALDFQELLVAQGDVLG